MSVRGTNENCLPASTPPTPPLSLSANGIEFHAAFWAGNEATRSARISQTMQLDFKWVFGFSFTTIQMLLKLCLKLNAYLNICEHMYVYNTYSNIFYTSILYLILYLLLFYNHTQFPISISLPANQAFLYPFAIVKLFRFAHPTAHLFPFTPTHTHTRASLCASGRPNDVNV